MNNDKYEIVKDVKGHVKFIGKEAVKKRIRFGMSLKERMVKNLF